MASHFAYVSQFLDTDMIYLQRLVGLLFGTTFMINLMFLPHQMLKFKHTFSFESNRPSLCMLCVSEMKGHCPSLFLCWGFRVGHQALQSLFTRAGC